MYTERQQKVNDKSRSPGTGGLAKFWSDYAAVVARQGIQKHTIKWYVKWSEDFAKSLRGRPLPNRTAGEVKVYLDNLARRNGVQDWQVAQARDALRILYQVFLGVKKRTRGKSRFLTDKHENSLINAKNKTLTSVYY